MMFLLAVTLSMDAFSLSLAYGTLGLSKAKSLLLSLIVGIYHFIMPIIGLYIGSKILSIVPISPKIVVFIILGFIGVQMIIESFKEEKINMLSFKEMLLFGFAVSIDSFSIGISLNVLANNPYISALIFSIFSFLFTYLGLTIGNRVNILLGKKAAMIGGITLILLAIFYLF